ncbi:MAG: hypothetical protein JWM90_516 [Thermoleophilia bacterium]|nr:hypothetical protein [Thermoleophilia bacterium]
MRRSTRFSRVWQSTSMDENSHIQRALTSVRRIQADIDPQSEVSAAPDVPRSATQTSQDAPTVFVSWAHTHSSWSKAKAREWESQVAAFAALLRRLGIHADVDLFHLDEAQDWTRYGPQQVERSQFTLVVMSQAWAERWSGTNDPREGAGAAAEADTLRGLFSLNQALWQQRIVVVLFPEADPGSVPPDLQRAARVSVDPTEPGSFEPLLRLLTQQPRYPKPPVGEVPVFDAAVGYEDSSTLVDLRGRLTEIEQRKRELGNTRSNAGKAERDRLDLSEAATRGFIDAELAIED